jgi:hypothetical protein
LKGKNPTLAPDEINPKRRISRDADRFGAHLEISRNGFAWRGAILSSRLARLARGVFVAKT